MILIEFMKIIMSILDLRKNFLAELSMSSEILLLIVIIQLGTIVGT